MNQTTKRIFAVLLTVAGVFAIIVLLTAESMDDVPPLESAHRPTLRVPPRPPTFVEAPQPDSESPDAVSIPTTSSRSSPRSSMSDVAAFYYPWYGTPELDGKWLHWNHAFLPHWQSHITEKYPKGRHVPPDDVGSNFFPKLGAYSSRDTAVIEEHCKQLKRAKVGVMVASWLPPGKADDAGEPLDSIFPALLEACQRHGLLLSFHLEPYRARSAESVRNDLVYIQRTYGDHPAVMKRERNGALVPVCYVYDPYHVRDDEWSKLVSDSGEISVRGEEGDAFLIALVVERKHRAYLDIGFDGLYSYFAVDGFTYGSSWGQWKELVQLAKAKRKVFVPCVGPGYVDEEVRPWNTANSRDRGNGQYYRNSWEAAMRANPELVAVTSFNEWHEGTQIEAAVQHDAGAKGVRRTEEYLTYGSGGAEFYLDETAKHVSKFLSRRI